MISLKNLTEKEYDQISKLYHKAFLKDERIEIQYLIKQLEGDNEWLCIYDHDVCVGFAYTVTFNNLTYLYYLAIEEDKRGMSYGSQTLQLLKQRYPNIILAIEEVDEKYENYEYRKNRKHFYIKNGFQDMNYTVNELGLYFQMLYCGKLFKQTDYDQLMIHFLGERYLKMRIYE